MFYSHMLALPLFAVFHECARVAPNTGWAALGSV